MTDPYASEEETKAILVSDTRTQAERKLAQMMTERGADEQGAESALILRQITLELLSKQPQQPPPISWPCKVIQVDFGDDIITLQMPNGNFWVSTGVYQLSPPPQPANKG
jgi:hypothetical protein